MLLFMCPSCTCAFAFESCSRTHIDIHGRWFPKDFKNWYSDDWFTKVYGSEHTLRGRGRRDEEGKDQKWIACEPHPRLTLLLLPFSVILEHKANTVGTRYNVDESGRFKLIRNVNEGQQLIRRYVEKFHPDIAERLRF